MAVDDGGVEVVADKVMVLQVGNEKGIAASVSSFINEISERIWKDEHVQWLLLWYSWAKTLVQLTVPCSPCRFRPSMVPAAILCRELFVHLLQPIGRVNHI